MISIELFRAKLYKALLHHHETSVRIEKLEALAPKENKESEQKNEIDPRWENLKKLLTDK